MNHPKSNSDFLKENEQVIIYQTIINIAFENGDVRKVHNHGFEFNFDTLTSNCGRYQLLYFGAYDILEVPYRWLNNDLNDEFRIYSLFKTKVESGKTYYYFMVIRRKLPTKEGNKVCLAA